MKLFKSIKSLAAAAALALVLLTGPSTAKADNLVNTVDTTLSFSTSSSAVVQYKIVANSASFDVSGCNVTDAAKATVKIVVPTGVTATPASLQFGTCNDFQSVTFSASTAGSYAISAEVSGGLPGSYWNLQPAQFMLNVSGASAPADSTAPVITPNVAGTLGTNGWYVSDVKVNWSVVENESALSMNGCDQTIVSADTAGLTLTCTATSAGGTSSKSVTIKRDATAPALYIAGSASGIRSICGGLPTKPTYAPVDALSGLLSQNETWTPSTVPSGVGSYTYTATATDQAGNKTTETRNYTVNYGDAFKGILQPINQDGSSRFKLGSTVPVKFQLLCGASPLANAVAKLNVKLADGTPDPGIDEALSTAAATTGNLFRYDSTAQQYIFNLSTKSGYTNPNGSTISAFNTGTWTLSVLLDDGNYWSVNIQLPK